MVTRMSVVCQAHVKIFDLVVAVHLKRCQFVIHEHLVGLDVDRGLLLTPTGRVHRVPVSRS